MLAPYKKAGGPGFAGVLVFRRPPEAEDLSPYVGKLLSLSSSLKNSQPLAKVQKTTPLRLSNEVNATRRYRSLRHSRSLIFKMNRASRMQSLGGQK
jgi:hypothetical protein